MLFVSPLPPSQENLKKENDGFRLTENTSNFQFQPRGIKRYNNGNNSAFTPTE